MPAFMYLILLPCLMIFTTMHSQPPFDLQGHRGCRGLMPENTWPAFRKALELGVTTLEMDVVISRDQQVVVSHEPYFHAGYCLKPDGTPLTKGEKINLYTLPYSEIKRYDTGSKGNADFPEQQKLPTHKPLLSEVLARAEAYCQQHNRPPVAYNIEIKSERAEYDRSQPQPAVFSDLVYATLQKHVPLHRVTVQSFDFGVLRYWNEQIKAGRYMPVQLAVLVSNFKGIEANLEELGFIPTLYSPYYKLLSSEKVVRLHRKGMRVIPWTVNTPVAMKEVIAMGVDGLITDYPNRYLELN